MCDAGRGTATMLTSDVLHGHARRQRRRVEWLHHFACLLVPGARLAKRGAPRVHARCSTHARLMARLSTVCCIGHPAGQNDDANVHKSNEPSEAAPTVASGD